MALRAVVEVAVHFESFRNIDLFHQGLYHLKARLRSDPASARPGGDAGGGGAGGDGAAPSDGSAQGSASGSPGAGGAGAGGAGGPNQATIAAAPCGALSVDLCAAAAAAPTGTKAEGDDDEDDGAGGGTAAAPSKAQRKGSKPQTRPDHHNLIPAHIIDDQGSYSTRSFLIRYCEEEVELNDIGEFRWEVASEELDTASGPSVILEVDLMFADLGQHGGADRFGESPDVDSTEFKCVSTARFRLCGAARGMHEYVPVIFDEYHCCMACCSVHSTLLDYRFRLHPSLPSGPSSAAAGGGDEADAMADAPSTTQSAQQLTGAGAGAGAGAAGLARRGPAGAPPAALSIEEALRGPAAAGPRDKLLQRMEAFCDRHIDSLAAARRKLGEWHEQMSKECLLPPQRELLALPTAPTNGATSFASPGGRGGGDSGRDGRRLDDRMSPGAAAAALALDLNEAACDVSRTWHASLAVLLQAPREATLCLRRSWERDSVRRWATTIIKDPPRPDLAACTVEDSCAIHSTSAEGLRRAAGEKDRGIEGELGVQDLSGIWAMEARPLIFEEQYLGGGAAASKPPKGGAPKNEDEEEPLDLPPSVPKKYEGVHLIVLVHGFQGNSFDMRLMKNNLALLYPDSIFLASSCNEDNTEGDINEMGVRLAQEVVNYICDWCPSGALGRLSFITHSLGGLIARAALPMLQEYSNKMFTFLSLSSCHLGVFQDRMSLFNTGFWVLKKWRQSTFLQQVSMGDHDNPRETFLYKLSRSRGLENFRHIVLTSCYEDQYGQLQSARAELCPEWAGQSDKEVYKEMVENIWSSVHPEQLLRLDMNFVIAEKNLDAFIGRTAHIQFLECQQMMRMLVHNYSGLFR